MNYIEYSFEIHPFEPFSEILIAELSTLEFESFIEEKPFVKAYLTEDMDSDALLSNVRILELNEVDISVTKQLIEKENWNEKWESSFQPVEVEDFCIIRAPFHKRTGDFKHEIIIEPKMSFGTGHHATTQLMIGMMKDLDLKGKTVLDMGSGTGVLAILADQMGATKVNAIDIEEWAYENMKENIERNHANKVFAYHGDTELLSTLETKYDVVLANINKNILLSDIEKYKQYMSTSALLILSGFFTYDNEELTSHCKSLHLQLEKETSKEDWSCLYFRLS